MDGYRVSDFLKNLSYMQGNGSPGGASGFDVDDFLQPDMDRSFALRRGAGNQGRIEEISRRLDEIAKEKKAIDTEKAMAEYKYLYDADPSAYMGLMHNRKTAEQTEQIRKGSEEATRQSNLQSAYKANNDGLLAARYSLADAENAYRQAIASGNLDAAESAKVKLDRERAMYNKYAKENEILRNKVMQAFGIAQEAPAVAQEGASGAENASQEDIAHQEAMNGLNAFQDALGEIEVLSGRIKPDNVAKAGQVKENEVKKWREDIARLQKVISSSSVGKQQKTDAQVQLDQLSDKLRGYSKPASKGGQAVKLTKEDYERAVAGKTPGQISLKGSAWLKAAKAAGANIPGIDQRIKDALAIESSMRK
jgi:hypothetical protein